MSATAVKERPILFSGPMVKAILDGCKTQTRRIVKPQPTSPAAIADFLWRDERSICIWPADKPNEEGSHEDHYALCPYGAPGSRLWVRETFCDRADYAAIAKLRSDRYHYAADGRKSGWKYRPSIHMPRAASRITLEIVSVRVERLQSISREDAIAEGICVLPLQSADDPSAWWQSGPSQNQARTPQQSFAKLWQSINGPGSWDANPFVWAISFKRLPPCAP